MNVCCDVIWKLISSKYYFSKKENILFYNTVPQTLTKKQLQILTLLSENIGIVVDFEKLNRIRAEKGKKSEEFALQWEAERLIGSGYPGLVARIKDVTDKPNYGYDFQSFSSLKVKRYIEVKTVSKHKGGHHFFLSENERAKSLSNELNNNYYSVKMNVETNDTIVFGDQIFVNERRDKRNPVHQIPLLMASRTDKPFSLPAMVIFDENFSPIARYFQFIDAEQLLLILKGESEE